MNCAAKIENFGPVWGASGVEGFFGLGNEYRHHRVPIIGPRFKGMTFTAKTTTLPKNAGNMPLNANLQPIEWLPQCIKLNALEGAALNAVGLSGPGAIDLFSRGHWQQRTKPFMVSFMPIAKGESLNRIMEFDDFARLLEWEAKRFQAPVAAQVNLSCPNVGNVQSSPEHFQQEVLALLEKGARLRNAGVVLIPKFNILTDPEIIVAVQKQGIATAVCISNTIPWRAYADENIPGGKLINQIPWTELFGEMSPLGKFGGTGGGLSGEPIRPAVQAYIAHLKQRVHKLHINACGGIMHPRHVDEYHAAGADSISIGTAAILRPWRVQSIIQRAHQLRWEGK